MVFRFSQFSVVFGGARQFLTSESTSLSNFAPDRPIHSSVRPLERSVGQSESRKGGLAGDFNGRHLKGARAKVSISYSLAFKMPSGFKCEPLRA